jgi:Na+/proline symporter
MHFRSVLPLLGLAASASAAMSASQVTANIDTVTQMSSDTNNIAQSISLTNLFSTTPVRQVLLHSLVMIFFACDD